MQWISNTYLLIDPRDEKPFYVGQTVDLKQRYKTHCTTRNVVYPRNVGHTPTQLRIQELYKLGFKPIIKPVGIAFDWYEARNMEDGWMRSLKAQGFNLTNVMPVKGNPESKTS